MVVMEVNCVGVEAHDDSARLENAIGRTWTKPKDNLNTVFPESLNW